MANQTSNIKLSAQTSTNPDVTPMKQADYQYQCPKGKQLSRKAKNNKINFYLYLIPKQFFFLKCALIRYYKKIHKHDTCDIKVCLKYGLEKTIPLNIMSQIFQRGHSKIQ